MENVNNKRRGFLGLFTKKGFSYVLAGSVLFSSMVGCYGRFPITNAIYDWNGDVTDNHIINSVIMVVLAIIPVYGLAIFVDALIINSIEFWSGDDVELSQTHIQEDGTVVTFAPGENPGEAILTMEKNGSTLLKRYYYRLDNGNTEIYTEEMELVSVVVPNNSGTFSFYDAEENFITELSKEELMSASSQPVL